MLLRRGILILTLSCALVTVRSAEAALTININAGAGLAGNAAALAAFDRAANQWEAVFSDNVTVNINADLTNLGNPTIIGQASRTLLFGGYTTIRNAMVADAADEGADDSIAALLPTAAQFTAVVPIGFTLSGNTILTQANAIALGLVNPTAGTDASITFNNQFSFDFDNSNGVGGGLMDFASVALHEIGHALGFISAVDDVDGAAPFAILPSTLDLFRFGNAVGQNPTNTAQFTSFPRFLAPAGDPRFDDLTNEWRFSTGLTQGDGRQASHWKDNDLTGVYIGAMDPTLSFGAILPLTFAEVRALDLIGWDSAAAAAVPEPATVAVWSASLALLGAFGARRRRAG